ncbi:restriction endonuclease [Streptomyces sp. NPDC005533]|uniref:restriction endonuclease n=1 Tax=Streptomyces sp. NPDC005533 TaxID=3364723 RepID=UPI0036AA9E8E
MHQLPADEPVARGIADWQAAEANAVDWLRWLGHPRATSTTGGADGGVDVVGDGAFAQVKFYGKAIGVQPLRELYGARAGNPGRLYFFINSGYSQPALTYAEQVDIAAFTYSVVTGRLHAISSTARAVHAEAVRRTGLPPAPVPLPRSPAPAPAVAPTAAPSTAATRRIIPLTPAGAPRRQPEPGSLPGREIIPLGPRTGPARPAGTGEPSEHPPRRIIPLRP